MDTRLDEFKALGATVIAVTGETPEHLDETMGDNPLGIPVLFDGGLQTAAEYGLAYEFSEELDELYQSFGRDMREINGMDEAMLPVPASYVIRQDGTIVFSYIDVDHTTRAEPDDLLAALAGE